MTAIRSDSSTLEIAIRIGARLKRVTVNEMAGPCPKCGGRDRFSINTARNIWNCRGCGVGGDAIELVRHILNLTFAEACSFVGDDRAEMGPRRATEPHWHASPPAPTEHRPDPAKVSQARAMWLAGTAPRGTIAETYLNSRGLALDATLAGPVLRWHGGVGALLALFRNIATGEAHALSRTFLSPAGEKLTRKFLGPVAGAAVMLDRAPSELTVAEGIETAMTARALGAGATWATGSAGAIARLPLIPGVTALRICVERDENGASERAAVACAERWQEAGRKVSFMLPPRRCDDLNDAIRQDRA